MHSYDTVLKLLLADEENTFFERITGAKRGRWLNVEFPSVTQLRVDLLFESLEIARRLIQVELQSRNDPGLPLRMALYALLIYQKFSTFPEQYVLYVGSEPLRMLGELRSADFFCRYKVVDISTIATEDFLKTGSTADAVLTILGATANRGEVIRRILQRIVKMKTGERIAALSKLTILAGLRRLEKS